MQIYYYIGRAIFNNTKNANSHERIINKDSFVPSSCSDEDNAAMIVRFIEKEKFHLALIDLAIV